MMRYIFCMLLGAFLMLGINSAHNKDMQKFRSETGATIDLQYHASTNKKDYDESFIQQATHYKDNHRVCYEETNCKANNGILSNSYISRPFSPFKNLKIKPSLLAIQTLSSLNSLLPEQNRHNVEFYTHLTKDSYRYYIYSLRRILI